MEYYLAIKINEIMLSATTWMDLDIIIQMNLFTKQKQSHRLQKQTWLLKGKGGGGVN